MTVCVSLIREIKRALSVKTTLAHCRNKRKRAAVDDDDDDDDYDDDDNMRGFFLTFKVQTPSTYETIARIALGRLKEETLLIKFIYTQALLSTFMVYHVYTVII